MSGTETVVTDTRVSGKYPSEPLLKRSQRGVVVGAWKKSVSPCHVWMNGSLVSLVWLGMKGGAGWLPQGPSCHRTTRR